MPLLCKISLVILKLKAKKINFIKYYKLAFSFFIFKYIYSTIYI